jgi:hypothetical protein
VDAAQRAALHNEIYPKTKADELKEVIQKLDRERELGDIQILLKLPEGRRFLWRMLFDVCGTFRGSLTGDIGSTGFNEGRRDIGLMILLEINNADHNVFAKMQSEYFSKKKSEEVQIKKLEKDSGGGK